MSITSNRNINQPNILAELNAFVTGATQASTLHSLDLSKNAIFLLKNVPAARDAILEYFCNLFDNAVGNYITRIETEIATGEMPETSSKEETTIAEIHMVLCNFVSQNPEAWASVISTWSLELLGELSTKYVGRAHVPVSAGLNEILQLWMGCRSTRTLIDITTQCLTSLMDSDSETWMNALLNTSVKHSPNFDWVVAHVGSCFPHTVITRVLSCGLKDFCQYKNIEIGANAPKLVSVVGILSHLAGSHFHDIRSAILELFSWSVRPYDLLDFEVKSQKLSTVPFLLQLASLSATLLKAMSTDINHTMRGHIIYQLYSFVNDWCKYFSSSKNLQDVIVNLILKTEQDGIQIITLLLNYIFLPNCDTKNQQITTTIKETAHEMLECVLQQIEYNVRTQQTVHLLLSVMNDLPCLFKLLLKPDQLVYESATRIVIMISKINPNIIIKATCFLLLNSETDQHLAMAVRIFTFQIDNPKSNQSFTEILKQNLLEIISDQDTNIVKFWLNLLTILKWEKSKKAPLLKNDVIVEALRCNLNVIVLIFGNEKFGLQVSHLIAEILYICFVNGTVKCSPNLIFNMTNSAVNYFFFCCSEPDNCLKEKGIKIITAIFEELSRTSRAGRIIALRELLERCLFKKENLLFGADLSENKYTVQNQTSLLAMNHKCSTTLMLAQRHSSIFHAGIIGSGCRKPINSNLYSRETIANNTDYLIRAIRSCCLDENVTVDSESAQKSPISLESLTTVSLLLVQFISPDVMYNGLPWPEEEFSKVTIERDLHIRRLFTKSPILWELLGFMGAYRPVLCYCSVLLRALTATLLHQWSSCAGAGAKGLQETTTKLVELVSLGQMLPRPLASVRDVLPVLRPHEVVQLLRDCLWGYLQDRDHVPSPALFARDQTGLHWRDPTTNRPQPAYCDTLRIIMQANIDKLGDQYVQLFYNV